MRLAARITYVSPLLPANKSFYSYFTLHFLIALLFKIPKNRSFPFYNFTKSGNCKSFCNWTNHKQNVYNWKHGKLKRDILKSLSFLWRIYSAFIREVFKLPDYYYSNSWLFQWHFHRKGDKLMSHDITKTTM